MSSFPPPASAADRETLRLAAVRAHAAVGTAPEPAFDAIVRVASHLFGMPMACIGLVDVDHVWRKAGVGLALDEVARHVSFADRIVAEALDGSTEPLVIEDLRQDLRSERHPLRQGSTPVCFFAGAPVIDADGQPIGALSVFDAQPRSFSPLQCDLLSDLARLASTAFQAGLAARRLQALADVDPLTGAAHRRQFEQALDVELRHAMRTGEAFAVLRLDVDGFADINTAYGAEAGDTVLREVGRRLRAQVRLGDLLARLGADDFGIVMRHGGEAEAAMLAERITTAVREPVDLGDDTARVSPGISVGVAVYSDEVASVVELLARADASLQQARARKESRWQVFGRLFEPVPGLTLVGKDG